MLITVIIIITQLLLLKFEYLQYLQMTEQKNNILDEGDKMLDEDEQPSKMKSKLIIRKDQLVRRWTNDFRKCYYVDRKLGQGSFGDVFLVTHKELNIKRALKVIAKTIRPNSNPQDQLQLLKKLDHPNIIKIYQYFESTDKWYIITQYFAGNELFDQIIKYGHLSEKVAANIINEVLKALYYIHSNHIAHRDIKAENILVRKEGEEYVVKVIDWGLGTLVMDKGLVRRCGTPEYCAPEVFNGPYNIECDMWSLGVLVYVMLIGKTPFKGKDMQQTLAKVRKDKINFDDPTCNTISLQAKKFIIALLQRNPSQRMKAQQCLKHGWILDNLHTKPNIALQLEQTLKRLKSFQTQTRFQMTVINFILNFIEIPKQEARLKCEFELLDQNGDGEISYDELLTAYRKIYGPEADLIVKKIFANIDLDGSGKISFSEFTTFAADISHKFSHKQLKEAFRLFDIDNSGLIDSNKINELIHYEKGLRASGQFEKIVSSIDLNNDGKIDFEEFIEHINQAVEKVMTKSSTVSSHKLIQNSEEMETDRTMVLQSDDKVESKNDV